MAGEIVVTDPTGRAWVVQLERTIRMGSAHDADLLLPGLDAPLVVSPTPSAPDALLQVGDADPRPLRDGQALAVGPYQVTLRHGPTCLLAALVGAEAGDDLAGTGQEEPGRPCPDRLLISARGL